MENLSSREVIIKTEKLMEIIKMYIESSKSNELREYNNTKKFEEKDDEVNMKMSTKSVIFFRGQVKFYENFYDLLMQCKLRTEFIIDNMKMYVEFTDFSKTMNGFVGNIKNLVRDEKLMYLSNLEDKIYDLDENIKTMNLEEDISNEKYDFSIIGLTNIPKKIIEKKEIKTSTKSVANIVQFYITCLDAIKTDTSKDKLFPIIETLLNELNKSKDSLKFDYSIVTSWYEKLIKMNINDKLSEDEVKQIVFDFGRSYNVFCDSLE
jgi:hypothetical protein